MKRREVCREAGKTRVSFVRTLWFLTECIFTGRRRQSRMVRSVISRARMNLVSHMARQTALQQQAVLLVLKHKKKQQRQRRATHAGVYKKPKKRRGGYNPKPRNGDPDAVEPRALWEFDMTKCIWCSLFDNLETFNERSYWGLYFYEATPPQSQDFYLTPDPLTAPQAPVFPTNRRCEQTRGQGRQDVRKLENVPEEWRVFRTFCSRWGSSQRCQRGKSAFPHTKRPEKASGTRCSDKRHSALVAKPRILGFKPEVTSGLMLDVLNPRARSLIKLL